MIEKIKQIEEGVRTAFVDSSYNSNLAFRPQFVSNNKKEKKKVISSLEDELVVCDCFHISVAFITMGGITPLLQTLKQLEKRGISGEILTTNYLNFSEPDALEKLNSLKNITLKMYDVEAAADEGFHTKGYIFKKDEIYRIIVGSSNITSAALTSNREWNTKIVSTEQGEYVQKILDEFNELWNSEHALDFDEFFERYKERYQIVKRQHEIAQREETISIEKYKLTPNNMQVSFIANLRKILAAGEERALLISATGTGKTYASAFAMRELGFKRVLFLVHRGQLAKQTKKSYERVFDKSVSMGLVGAGFNDYDKDYVFATVQTLNRDTHLFQYQPDAFDCIILDEAHHTSANTYQKVMSYFKPKLWLGMTATPDKRDDSEEGRNIYEIFIPWTFVMNDELWNLMPMDSSLNSSKSNKLPLWDPFFERFAHNQYSMYELIYNKESIHKLYEACYRDNLHSIWANRELYRNGNTKDEFYHILEKNMHPVYDSARRQGYDVWNINIA